MSGNIVLLVGAGAIFISIVLVVLNLATVGANRSGVAKALTQIDTVYSPGGSAAEDLRHRSGAHAVRQVASMGTAVNSKGMAARLQLWLDYAGNPVAWPPERIMSLQGVGMLAVAAFGLVVGLAVGLSIPALVLAVVAAAAFGFYLPFFVVFDLGQRRQQEIRKQLPDALDLLTLSVEAGLGFDAAMAQVATTMPGALSREFSRVLHEMQMGQRRAEALRGMGTRTTVLELRTIATSIVQASELGVPIATVLREQSKEMRIRRRQRAEEQANKVSVKLIFPLILCLLPALFLFAIGPGMIRIIENFAK